MADETYILPEEPVYQEAIRRLQNTDPVDADGVLNPLIQALIGNTEFVRQLAVAIAEQNAADHTAIRQETAQSIQEAVAAIPTPDVSGQISDHNDDDSAHDARFQALDSKFAPAGHSHSAADVGAAPSGHTHTAADVGAAPSEHTHSAADVGASPSGHTHTAADVGASPSGHTHTAAQVGASPSGHKHTKGEITDFPASLPASDVPAWAKKSTKPTYTASEVGAAPSGHKHTKSEITDFPTSMPASDVPAWAKKSAKPTYTASEVGAAPSNHTHTAAQVGAATTAYVDSRIPFEGTYEPVGGTLNLKAEIDDQYFYEYQIGYFGVALGSFTLATFLDAQVGQYVRGSVQFNNIYASETSNDLEGFVFFCGVDGHCHFGNLGCSGGDDFTFDIFIPSTAAKNAGGQLFIIAFGNYK